MVYETARSYLESLGQSEGGSRAIVPGSVEALNRLLLRDIHRSHIYLLLAQLSLAHPRIYRLNVRILSRSIVMNMRSPFS